MNVWLFFFAEQKLHLLLTSVSSQCGCYSAIHFENEMRAEQGRAYVSNKKCHEQNRHILVPSPALICTICCHFRWGGVGREGEVDSNEERSIKETSSFKGLQRRFQKREAGYVGQMLKCLIDTQAKHSCFTFLSIADTICGDDDAYRLSFDLEEIRHGSDTCVCLQRKLGRGSPAGLYHVWIDRTIRVLPDV